MRIVIDFRPALRARTGAGEYLFRLVQALVARERLLADAPPDAGLPRLDALTLFTSSWKDRPLAEDIEAVSSADRSSRSRLVRVVDWRIPVTALNLLWHRLEWPPVEALAGGPFDVAYSPHPLLMPARHAAQVTTIHDLDFLAHPHRTVREIRRDYPKLVRDHARRAAHIIVPSHYTARQVENELGVSPESMTVCYAGVPDWPPFETDRPRRHVLFLGTLEERKNIGTLLSAYAQLLDRMPDAPPLVLAGRATDAASPWLEQLARAPLAGHARHVGYVSDDERRRLFAEALAFVLPSYEEGFGIPVLEAMAADVPVIVSDRGSLPEVAGDAGLVVAAEDAEALSGAIERVIGDEGLRAAMAARGRQQARRFRWSETAHSVMTAFARAIDVGASR